MLKSFAELSEGVPVPPVIIYHGTRNQSEERDQIARECGAIGATYYPSVLYASVLMELVRIQPSAYCQLKMLAEKMGLHPLLR